MSIAKPLPHDAAALHVNGSARYVDDIPTPSGTLHLAFGTSPIAAGTLNNMNLNAVRATEGVITVLTAGDLEFDADVSPSAHDEPLLAEQTVAYVGQPTFLVIAESHTAARKAARLAQYDIIEGEPIFTIEEALAANSRFEDGPRIYAKGDAKAHLVSAAHSITGSISMGGQEHFYLEGQAALALPDENGDVLIHSSTQHPTEIQHKVAHAIGKPMHAVRVETRRMGGGFGGKESQGNALAVACAIAALKMGKPCKMRYDRDDDMIITGKRHDFRIDYTCGFDSDGLIQAIDVKHYTRCGWAQDLSLPVADRAMLHADNAYNLPNIRIESHRLKTNIQSATAYRGFGGPQGMLGMERIVDHIAQTLGVDPAIVRQKNFYGSGGSSTGKMKPQTTPYGQEVTDSIVAELTDTLMSSSDYFNRRATVDEWNSTNQIIKRGIAMTPVKFGISFTLTHLNQAGALVHVYQ
ncbi:MAG: molybdopterin-dependent oxidoreductase, partial [Rhodobacteraceae bacterium]|nr:molybdopterin-dependent oxidoreductase [Paracoccaceae bacterium]